MKTRRLIVSLAIAGYVLWQGLAQMPKVLHLLMNGAPKHLDRIDVIAALCAREGVRDVHHLHLWHLDEQRTALEAHIVFDGGADIDALKLGLKAMLRERFAIDHATLEFERKACDG